MSDVTIQIEGIERTSKLLEAYPALVERATLHALKRATSSARTAANRLVAQDTGISVSDAREAIRIQPPTAENLNGELRASVRRIPAIKLGARGPEPSYGRGSGVRWRGGSHRKAFIATMRGSGHRGVFVRVGKKRTPIREVMGPSPGMAMKKHAQAIARRGSEVFRTEFQRLLKAIAEKRNDPRLSFLTGVGDGE